MLKPRASDTVDPGEDPGMYDGFMPEIQAGKGPGRGGAPTRRSYTYRYRATIVSRLRDLESRRKDIVSTCGMTPMQYLADKAMVAESYIYKWAKDERRIVQQASSQIVANLTKTPHPKEWFPSAEHKLYSLFRARHTNDQKVSPRWITVTFNTILREDHADDRR